MGTGENQRSVSTDDVCIGKSYGLYINSDIFEKNVQTARAAGRGYFQKFFDSLVHQTYNMVDVLVSGIRDD